MRAGWRAGLVGDFVPAGRDAAEIAGSGGTLHPFETRHKRPFPVWRLSQLVSIPEPALGPRRLDIGTTFSTDRYRPLYSNKRGLSVFLHSAA
jgi:hypothetical protein